jgi:hypothetical protein
MKCMVDRGSELGIESFVIGMPHRGRLNVLANVMRKPMPLIFKEFQGTHYDLEEYVFCYTVFFLLSMASLSLSLIHLLLHVCIL